MKNIELCQRCTPLLLQLPNFNGEYLSLYSGRCFPKYTDLYNKNHFLQLGIKNINNKQKNLSNGKIGVKEK